MVRYEPHIPVHRRYQRYHDQDNHMSRGSEERRRAVARYFAIKRGYISPIHDYKLDEINSDTEPIEPIHPYRPNESEIQEVERFHTPESTKFLEEQAHEMGLDFTSALLDHLLGLPWQAIKVAYRYGKAYFIPTALGLAYLYALGHPLTG